MIEQIKKLKNQFTEDLERHLNDETLESLRTKYLSRRGLVTDLFNQMKQVDADLRPQVGKALNELKNHIQHAFQTAEQESKNQRSSQYKIDLTLPGRQPFIAENIR